MRPSREIMSVWLTHVVGRREEGSNSSLNSRSGNQSNKYQHVQAPNHLTGRHQREVFCPRVQLRPPGVNHCHHRDHLGSLWKLVITVTGRASRSCARLAAELATQSWDSSVPVRGSFESKPSLGNIRSFRGQLCGLLPRCLFICATGYQPSCARSYACSPSFQQGTTL